MSDAISAMYPKAHLSIGPGVTDTMGCRGVCQHGGAQWPEASPQPPAWGQLPASSTWTPEATAPGTWHSQHHLCVWDLMLVSWWITCRWQHFGCFWCNSSFRRQKLGCNFKLSLGSRSISARTWLCSYWPGCRQTQTAFTMNSLI